MLEKCCYYDARHRWCFYQDLNYRVNTTSTLCLVRKFQRINFEGHLNFQVLISLQDIKEN
jgi:hypothetical protein